MKYLNDTEVNDLIERIKSGDNAAWEKLCQNYEAYVHDRGWKRLKKLDMADSMRKDMEEDLYMAGWQGFIDALKHYVPGKGRFLTYATHYIDGEISKELDLLLNRSGFIGEAEMSFIPFKRAGKERYVDVAEDQGDYTAERRILQMLEILSLLTDEAHTLSKEKLGRMLILYRNSLYKNGTKLEADNTFNKSVAEMLMQLNPQHYTGKNDGDYKIKYDGYKENYLQKKVKMNQKNPQKVELAPTINGLSFVHTFSYADLDKLIQLVSFSDMLSLEEKELLISKLVNTSSAYYKTPFWDGDKLKFNPQSVHSRFSRRNYKESADFSVNLKLIQEAVNQLGQIRFRFNRYNAEHELCLKDSYVHELSPYHLVVYHDNYYCIGLKKDDKRIWHYRVDLMSDIEIVRDEDGKIVPVEIREFEGLPICNAYWDPEKYMAEHLNMAYDEPQDIRIKIKDTDYTVLHDWFGDHYEKTNEECGKGFDIVKVRTSPSMIVHWAMQYGTRVEVLDEEIRKSIREEVKRMEYKYGY